MKAIDNSLINEPCMGKLIEEKCAIRQLEDNCIYLLADPKSTIVAKFMEAESWIQNKLAKEEYFNEYGLDVLESIELKTVPLLQKRYTIIREICCCLFTCLNMRVRNSCCQTLRKMTL